MSYDTNNIFAKIIRGEIPSDKIYEDAHVLAFKDIRPEEYVGIFFSGGRAPEYIREDADLLRLTRWFWEQQKPCASVCHGVEIPARAGIVQGLRMATVAKCQFDLEVCGGVYVNELGLDESDAVLAMLAEHVKSPTFQCRFHWTEGAVAFWDNRAVQHFASPDYTERRRMHRVLLAGDRPT